MQKEKIIIYQVLPRLFGNQVKNPTPNGDLQENGCGKLNDFTDKALQQIQALGANYIWYTGVIEHATQTDFSEFGILPDHPAIVKGKAGSPYAIKDYYDIAPALATQVNERMAEFEDLIKRSHKNGLKVIIDFVPNHVARQYHSDQQTPGTIGLGDRDDPSRSFSPYNNFYYIPQAEFNPHFDLNAQGFDRYHEYPAKATGNDQFTASPSRIDWYETIKLNYGVDYQNAMAKHFDPIPDTWFKMKDILLFWAQKGIDAFRCDMVEMVPVDFWEWAIPIVKENHPHILFIAEAYNPNQYKRYLYRGQFDYLYDKVGLYDTLKSIIQGHAPASQITSNWQSLDDLQTRMLNFLENHDEQRIASSFFAADPNKAIPAMTISACLNTCPMMIYFGQEFGESGMNQEGFSGLDGRTSIFDYWSVDTIRRWYNKGKCNFTKLSDKEINLYEFYKKILNIAKTEQAITQGLFFDLMYVNTRSNNFNPDKQYAFLRKHENEILFIIVNFDSETRNIETNIPSHAFEYFKLSPKNRIDSIELLTQKKEVITFTPERPIRTQLKPYSSKILKLIYK
ncbi:alpha amylase catalytic region [Bacteroides coprosuis DSM 18011]|uniref:Alpha amylase catalytic region n=2 Tax=Bacteroides coprosuis TaxID=151276 RepID=F3ZPD4_9BACE|nr:alpha amylase catalytic region [Bacteroides coprosuis DSM 18011]